MKEVLEIGISSLAMRRLEDTLAGDFQSNLLLRNITEYT